MIHEWLVTVAGTCMELYYENFFEFTHMKEIVAAWLVYVEERGFNESFNHVSWPGQ